MKTGLKTVSLLSLGVSLLQLGCAPAQHSPGGPPAAAKSKPAEPVGVKPATAVAAPTNAPALTNIEDKVGYAIGMSVGNNLKRANFEINPDQIMQGMKDVLEGRELQLTEPQAQQAIMDYQKQRQHELAETNLKQGEAFLAQNKGKEGVKAQPVTLPDGRTAELQYKIITEGTGEIPKSNDTVNVNYRGTLINGTEFDSSARRGGRPYKFVVNQPNISRGWTEALQMMKVGAKWELYIPASLAFDERPRPVPPGSTVIYELELVDVEKPKPLTSDIIRVPSAEEMKAGAKIEVIKAEDAEKMAKTNQGTNQVAPEKK